MDDGVFLADGLAELRKDFTHIATAEDVGQKVHGPHDRGVEFGARDVIENFAQEWVGCGQIVIA